MEKYIILRSNQTTPGASLPFSAFLVADDKELQERLGKDILEGDIIIEAIEKFQVRPTSTPWELWTVGARAQSK